MENKTIATAAAVVLAGALTATLILNPITSPIENNIVELTPTPTATIEVVVTPSPTSTPTPSASAIPTLKPTVTAKAATPTPHIATLEDYAIRTILDDGTVIVTYAPDTPIELLETIMPSKKGVNK